MTPRDLALITPHGSLHGQLLLPAAPRALVLMLSTHHTPGDAVALQAWTEHGYAALGMELLTLREIQFADASQNIPRLTERALQILDLIRRDAELQALPLHVFAHGNAIPAAIRAAARRDSQIRRLICHGGRPDQAGREALELLNAPTCALLDAGDEATTQAWQRAATYLSEACTILTLRPGDDPVALACDWLAKSQA